MKGVLCEMSVSQGQASRFSRADKEDSFSAGIKTRSLGIFQTVTLQDSQEKKGVSQSSVIDAFRAGNQL